jgi:hypothetical protein
MLLLQIPNFIKAWDEFVGKDFNFEEFVIHYAPVPMQERRIFQKYDDEVFFMKFLETWDPRVNLVQKFSASHMADFRVLYINEMVFSPHNNNKKVVEVVRNHKAMVSAFSFITLIILTFFMLSILLPTLVLLLFFKRFFFIG